MAARHRLPDLIRALKLTQSKPIAGPNGMLPSLRRAFSLYDQINLIDNVPEDQIRFQGYTDTGFKVNGRSYEGSLLCVGNLLMSWSPTKLSEVTPDRLDALQLMRKLAHSHMDLLQINMAVMDIATVFGSAFRLHAQENISPFSLETPKSFQILIIGCGRQIEPINPDLRRFIHSTGMKLEALDSRNAVSTYNILNEEGRIVAAALLPFGVSSF